MTRHWTEDDCIDRIYGIGPGDEHLGECADCRALWQRFEARRTAVRAAIEESGERVRIPAFAGVAARRKRMRLKLVPALAAAGAVALALLVIHPAPQEHVPAASNTAIVSASDAQFFDEVAALDQSVEPRAAQTAEALFAEGEN